MLTKLKSFKEKNNKLQLTLDEADRHADHRVHEARRAAEEQILLLHTRLRDVETHNGQLIHENNTLKETATQSFQVKRGGAVVCVCDILGGWRLYVCVCFVCIFSKSVSVYVFLSLHVCLCVACVSVCVYVLCVCVYVLCVYVLCVCLVCVCVVCVVCVYCVCVRVYT